MAIALQRLGRSAYSHRRIVLAFWLVVIVGLGAIFGSVHRQFDSTFSIPGTQSQQATNLLATVDPSASGGAGTIVFDAPAGQSLENRRTRSTIEQALKTAGNGPGIAAVSEPYNTDGISASKQIGRASVTFTAPTSSVTAAQRSALVRALAPVRSHGVRTYFGGAAAPPLSSGSTELVGIVIAFFILVVTFGALLTAGMPLGSAILGVAFGIIGVGIVNGITQLNTTASTLAVMLGLAVGNDYALFIITRYRSTVRELARGSGDMAGVDRREAVGVAVATAGSAVVFAGTTVVIALAALTVCGIPFLTQMGLAGAGTIVLSVLIALTLIPALLGFAGPRALKGKIIDASPTAASATWGRQWVGVVTRHRGLAAILVVVVLGALAIPVLGMREGLPEDGGAPASTTQRHAYDLITRGFGPGFNGPLTIVAQVPKGSAPADATKVESQLTGLAGVKTVTAPKLQPGGTLVTLSVIPTTGPGAAATVNLVHAIRARAGQIATRTGARISVTGATATNVDIVQRVSSKLLTYLLVVIALALLLLMVAFRSILVPLTALFGFLLTIGASLGAVVLVFQHGDAASLFGVPNAQPILSFLPILVIGVLFGLAMDYEVFLVSRMREERSKGVRPEHAVRNGFSYGSRVVTAAALIMIGVFAGFVIPDDPTIKAIGFSLAVGILFDAFLVRMTFIPAVMSMLGDRAWHLPRWLDAIIPHIDLDGAALTPGDRPTHRIGKGRQPEVPVPAGKSS